MATTRAMRTGLLVLARAPVAGQAKTRLIPALGPGGAAAFQAALTRRAIATARAAGLGPVRLCCAPDAGHPFFADCLRSWPVEGHDQHGGDLGARMHHALSEALDTLDAAILIGTDVPILDTATLRLAERALRSGCEAVFSPAEDGGYALVGPRRPCPALFTGVAWGTGAVWAETRQRLAASGIVWRALPSLWDIDEPADLDRLRREHPAIAAGLDRERGELARSLTGEAEAEGADR